jgi:hypothetical protein
MRELHGYHGEHRRHARDQHVPADNAATRAHDSPKRAAQDALKLKMISSPEARKEARFDYEQKVKAVQAEYAARHAKPKPGDEARLLEQLNSQEPRPEHAPPETRDKPANRIARRSLSEPKEAAGQAKRERSWLPRADAVKGISDIGMVATAFAVAFGDASARWDAVAAAGVSAVVSNIAWANRRRKEKHGDRSEG